jgi:cupin 2 domain-containing protein
MPLPVRNLLESASGSREEQFFPLLEQPGFRLERIVSNGAASPAGFWCDQETAEWVALLAGGATLEFEDGPLMLRAGECLLIPPHVRHRVADVSADAVWLALHFDTHS